MALIRCPECGKEVSDTCDTCIHCGYRFRNGVHEQVSDYVIAKRLRLSDNQATAIVLIVLGIIFAAALLGIILIILGVLSLSKNTSSDFSPHDIAYYHEIDRTIILYSSADMQKIVKPEDITNIKHKGNDDLIVTLYGKEKLNCGKCSEGETVKVKNYLEQIKNGTFRGL